jgi:hypothetical protein
LPHQANPAATSKGDDMYLHPLIQTDLIRQRRRELSRLALHRGQASRSLPGKRAAATLGVLFVALVAALALTSGALAATAKKQPATTAKQQQQGFRIVQGPGGKITIYLGKRIVYVYYPAPAGPVPTPDPDASSDCENYQSNCTPEQNCQYWGVCDPITNTSSNSQTAAQESSASDSSADGSGQAESADPAPLVEVQSDSSAGQAAAETATALADPSQYEDC